MSKWITSNSDIIVVTMSEIGSDKYNAVAVHFLLHLHQVPGIGVSTG